MFAQILRIIERKIPTELNVVFLTGSTKIIFLVFKK